MQLQSHLGEIQKQGLGLATISYDSRELLAAFAQQRGIMFPLLADPGSQTIKRFGILNTVVAEALGPNRDDPAVKADVQKYISVVNPSPTMQGIPFPGTFIVNRQGRVTSRSFEDFYIERTTVSNVLQKLGAQGGAVAGARIATEHLELTTYPSDAAVAPGNRFSVVLEIAPKRGMHVYAPGASGYRVVSVQIAAQPFVRALPLTYPASEIYHFKPLNERTPVYQKPFRLVQEIVIEGDPKAQAAFRDKDALTITGMLEYQACDDKICYNPMSLPLSWTLDLRPLVRERPSVAR